jgi:hypothetical protein
MAMREITTQTRRVEQQVIDVLARTPSVMQMLVALRELALPDPYVAAGALRSADWSHRHQRAFDAACTRVENAPFKARAMASQVVLTRDPSPRV